MMYQLDATAAKAGSGGSGRIDSTGKYPGKVKFCSYWETDNGAKMVKIKFESDSGQAADIKICTHSGNAKGNQPTYGYKQFQAIMACLKTRALNLVEQVVEDYDPDAGEVKPIKRQVFKEMTGAKLGFALYRHDQTSDQGKDFFVMEIAAPFNYETEQVAQEVIDSKPAEKLGRIVLSLSDKDSRQKASGSVGGYDEYSQFQQPDDDDLPF